MIEVDVLIAGLEFTALEVHVVGTECVFGRREILVMVAVGSEAPVVKAAEIKIADFFLFSRRERSGVHREDRRRSCTGPRAPSHTARDKISLQSCMSLPPGNVCHPVCQRQQDAVKTAKGDEEHRFLAAITVTMRAAVVADIADGGVLGGEAVVDVCADPIVDFSRR